jgi:hypothetical protein
MSEKSSFQLMICRQENTNKNFLYELGLNQVVRLKQSIPNPKKPHNQPLGSDQCTALPWELVLQILKYRVVDLFRNFEYATAKTIVFGFKPLIDTFYKLFYEDASKVSLYSKKMRLEKTFNVLSVVAEHILALPLNDIDHMSSVNQGEYLKREFPLLDILVKYKPLAYPYDYIYHTVDMVELDDWLWVSTGNEGSYLETFAFVGEQRKGIWKVQDYAWPLVVCQFSSTVSQYTRPPDIRSWTIVEEIIRLGVGNDLSFRMI